MTETIVVTTEGGYPVTLVILESGVTIELENESEG